MLARSVTKYYFLLKRVVIKQFCCIFHLDSVWKNDFDFIHVLLRAVQRQDVQSSMERYKAR